MLQYSSEDVGKLSAIAGKYGVLLDVTNDTWGTNGSYLPTKHTIRLNPKVDDNETVPVDVNKDAITITFFHELGHHVSIQTMDNCMKITDKIIDWTATNAERLELEVWGWRIGLQLARKHGITVGVIKKNLPYIMNCLNSYKEEE